MPDKISSEYVKAGDPDNIWPAFSQEPKTHHNSDLQPARSGLFNLAKSGQG